MTDSFVTKEPTNKMLCVLPVHRGDVFLLINLLKWIAQLGGCQKHSALVVADAGLDWKLCDCVLTLTSQSFEHVTFLPNAIPIDGWIPGSNSLWATAATYCQTHKINGWFWLEPDAIPLKPGWLDKLQKVWTARGFDFLAGTYKCPTPGLPPNMMTGIAVYPANAIEYFPDTANVAFDVQLSGVVKSIGGSELIQHFWGLPDLPPTFRKSKTSLTSPRHAFTFETVKPDAVVFHRSKDGTLIELLRTRLDPKLVPPKLLVVLPACSKDAGLMANALHWMTELDGRNEFECLLSYDSTVKGHWLERLRERAHAAFEKVHEFEYPRPPREVWPDACNLAFQSTAHHINAHLKLPWLWFEADCVPLKPNWLPTLNQEYQNCGLPIMGPVVEGVGHMNGTAIYPANFPSISHRAMSASTQAWDTDMTYDLLGKVHACNRVFCHRWGMANGGLHPTSGPPPHFSSRQSVELWIPSEAVLFHRCKDGSLIDQLRTMKK